MIENIKEKKVCKFTTQTKFSCRPLTICSLFSWHRLTPDWRFVICLPANFECDVQSYRHIKICEEILFFNKNPKKQKCFNLSDSLINGHWFLLSQTINSILSLTFQLRIPMRVDKE